MDFIPYYDPTYSVKQAFTYDQQVQQQQQWAEQLFIPQSIISLPPQPPQSTKQRFLLSTSNDLSLMSQKVIRLLCCGNTIWDTDRITNFSNFCDRLMLQIDIPKSVVLLYLSLKYIQRILANSVNEYNLIDLSDIAHEYSLFTVSLMLAYKFLEDNPPFMRQWSILSMIPIEDLVRVESQILKKLDYSLDISVETFDEWTDQCNEIFHGGQDILKYDLHMTRARLGCSILLPVLLDDFYFNHYQQEQQMMVMLMQPQQELFAPTPTEQQYDDPFYYDINDTIMTTNLYLPEHQVPVPMDPLWYLTHNSTIF
ncbi:hypothetical protein [Parasitella parasitica]|uniref:Cyclin N-terminal domain-containing protein n=1 Tax=Parasitella parasitica TaxID=35722 RepID=A0A0B7N7C0_9FUNG|nr:hypothetical protein [Parasitella parasitica]